MAEKVTAGIVVIGNEVLSGRTADVNIPFIARRLTDVGIELREVRVVQDDEAAIAEAVLALAGKFTYVFTTGGIGPTHDDITMAAIAKAFGVRVVRDPVVEDRLRGYYGNRLVPASLRMADFPEGARVIYHDQGWAPGCMIENVAILAGSPVHMQVMFEALIPLLQQGTPLHTKTIDAWLSESRLADDLRLLQTRFETVELGSYPYKSDVGGEAKFGTAVVIRGEDGKAVEDAAAAVSAMVVELGGVLR
ncbi:MAG: competence/damage-inducible protein A [Alphaproteobacteria bacterium CG_4_10_14_0_8_um_filter_53_9]|nr:MAG: competence/damage-inducible protein A [Alphaproteobacteria bacterium CG_4_10_14_0_8_um_filter_53_9]